MRKYVIPETEICRKHVKKCSGSVENAATETWETVKYPLTETHVCRCVSATESRVSTMFKFTDTWFFVLWNSVYAEERELLNVFRSSSTELSSSPQTFVCIILKNKSATAWYQTKFVLIKKYLLLGINWYMFFIRTVRKEFLL